jgi:hypothetical protein
MTLRAKHSLRVSRSGFKLRIARPAAEDAGCSLNLDRERVPCINDACTLMHRIRLYKHLILVH